MIRKCYSFYSCFGTFSLQITWATAGSVCLAEVEDPGGGVTQVNDLSSYKIVQSRRGIRRGCGPPGKVQVPGHLGAWHVLHYFTILDNEKLLTFKCTRQLYTIMCLCLASEGTMGPSMDGVTRHYLTIYS